MLEIDVHQRHGWSVASIIGEVDLAELPAFQAGLGPLSRGPSPRIVVDLTGVDLLDSSGLGALLGVRRRVARNRGEVRLVAPEGDVSALLRSVGFDRIFVLSTEVDLAIGADPIAAAEPGDG